MKYIDLHTHTTASDGSLTPSELARHAADQGLAAFAVTDHDTIGGIAEADKAAKELGIQFVPGVELSAATPEGSMHILGLWIAPDDPAFEAFLAESLERRKKRNEKMFEKLRDIGIDIPQKEIDNLSHKLIGRPHIAKFLVEKGYVKDVNEAFDKYLGANGLAYVPKNSPPPEKVVKILADSGALPIIAHPLLKKRPDGWLDDQIANLSKYGLAGLEAWHSAHSPEQTETILKLAKKHDLGVSGGSDFHGRAKPDIKLGSGNGNLKLPISILDDLMKIRQRKNGHA